ncbi:hypothetical protein [Amaricoccus sp.]|uniref:hypothetical protein n=1 Tax=Amaricoccus sp. TaxID=1872485 RepID=UPI00260A203B|nr:hypothetical protein [Amaricoccus sp.]HRO11513.1 hypothetical protein [Amaricoccus sp.]
MIELLIAACLSFGAPECRNFSLLYDPAELSLVACATRGQAEIARWHESHPRWTVSRWTCAWRTPGSVDI